jgi:hypothetical protein
MKATISSTRSHSTLSRILVRRTSAPPRSAPDVLMLAPPLSEVSAPHVEPLRKSLESSRGSLFDTICILDSWAYVRRSLPVGCPLKGTTISSRGPADACTTGITPAAFGRVKSIRNERKLRGRTYHEFDHIDTKMFVYHRTYADACSGQPAEHKRVGSVHHNFNMMLQRRTFNPGVLAWGDTEYEPRFQVPWLKLGVPPHGRHLLHSGCHPP